MIHGSQMVTIPKRRFSVLKISQAEWKTGNEAISEDGPLRFLSTLATKLSQDGKSKEATAMLEVLNIATSSPDYGGMGLSANTKLTAVESDELVLLTSACKETLFRMPKSRQLLLISACCFTRLKEC